MSWRLLPSSIQRAMHRLTSRSIWSAVILQTQCSLRPAQAAYRGCLPRLPLNHYTARAIASAASSRHPRNPILSALNKSKSAISAKSQPPSRPFVLLDYHFYRIAFLTVLALYLPFYYITSTTFEICGIQGNSMYPLLRPSSSTLLESSETSKLPRNSPSTAALLARPHPKDSILVLPTTSAYPRSAPFIKLLSFFNLLPPSPLHNDPFNYNIRLADDPASEGGNGTRSNLERGMIVVYRPPYEPGHGYNPDRLAIKRIVGLEGDIVVPQGAIDENIGTNESRGRQRLLRLWQDGGEFDDICSGRWVEAEVEDKQGEVEMMAGVRVPYGHVWVEGVNRADTVDSNDHGVISKSLIQGVAVGVIWPRGRECDWSKSWRRDCGKRVFRVKEGRGVFVKREDKVGDGVDREWEM